VACDFFSLNTVVRHRFYVLHFIEIDAPKVYLAGVIANPVGEWARSMGANGERGRAPLRRLSDPNQRTDTGMGDRAG
jgi:hypothetical protein